jgi:hypothetical protein
MLNSDFVYKIDIDPIENPRNPTTETLDKMLEVMEAIEHIDDAGFVLRMKLLNNVEFLVDQLMEEYEQRKR